MNYERKIEELCRQLAAADSDEDAATLAREISLLLHLRVEQLQGRAAELQAKFSSMRPLLGPIHPVS